MRKPPKKQGAVGGWRKLLWCRGRFFTRSDYRKSDVREEYYISKNNSPDVDFVSLEVSKTVDTLVENTQ